MEDIKIMKATQFVIIILLVIIMFLLLIWISSDIYSLGHQMGCHNFDMNTSYARAMIEKCK